MFDIVIKNGLIVDGAGAPGFRADLGIAGDRIAQIGELDAAGARMLDAEGCVVAPGFIDIHSHTDELVLANPSCESKVTQGVTTEVSGNCGDSAAPRGGCQDLEEYMSWLAEHGIEPTWRTMGGFFARLDELPMTINFATLVGHGVVRAAAMGYQDRKPTESEQAEMRRLVEQAVEEGAFGLSTGLIYPPGCYAGTEELVDLCRVVARCGGIYATHVRDEAEGLLAAVEEAVRIGREAGVGIQISHHKACGRKSWGKVKDSLAMIEEARSQGLDVWADQYPYLATSTGLGAMLPRWAHNGGTSALLARLSSQAERHRLREQLIRDAQDGRIADLGGWDSVVVNLVRQEKNSFCEGRSIAEIAQITRKHPVDTVLDLLLDERGSIGIMHFVVNEQDVADVIRHPAVVIGSDATARAAEGPLSRGKPHPRAYGTFPRVLGKYVREEGILSLEEAVAKMTGRTARRLSLVGRGILAEGYYADVTVFDPDSVADTATFKEPYNFANGIRYVLVNGEVVLEDGHLADVGQCAPGRVLRRGMN
ncbi:MAG TPA: D-aminoacylase [Armatimonadota bacterium]|nr:D-aminoacylase [Armatimonadota bacterium]